MIADNRIKYNISRCTGKWITPEGRPMITSMKSRCNGICHDKCANRNTAGKPTEGRASQASVLAMKGGIQLSMHEIVRLE